jgi:hypothetical protein
MGIAPLLPVFLGEVLIGEAWQREPPAKLPRVRPRSNGAAPSPRGMIKHQAMQPGTNSDHERAQLCVLHHGYIKTRISRS